MSIHQQNINKSFFIVELIGICLKVLFLFLYFVFSNQKSISPSNTVKKKLCNIPGKGSLECFPFGHMIILGPADDSGGRKLTFGNETLIVLMKQQVWPHSRSAFTFIRFPRPCLFCPTIQGRKKNPLFY